MIYDGVWPLPVLNSIREELIPRHFRDETAMEAVFGQLVARGLVVVFSGLGALAYEPSDQLMDIGEMVNFEAAANMKDF
jgi:hypothetical protein